MEIHELRIGNYISFTEDGSVAKVTGIHTSPDGLDVEIGDEVTWIELDQFEPIGLNQGILYDSGFKPYGEGNWHHDAISLHEADFIFNSKSDRVKYVHELQNLFYDLTNEELEVKI